MWRYQALCRHCHFVTLWEGSREICRDYALLHLKEEHNLVPGREPSDYEISEQRQCDYCLEEYLDHCTKCDRDFCRFHAGDIDGLCGGCI